MGVVVGRVKIDSKWRVVLPREVREGLKPGDEVVVERLGSTIVMRKASREELVRKFEELKLYAGRGENWDAEVGKHRFGGVKH
ncbi:AbrB/MazE/SpoVT family DNA-binding domain-containing protein [Infirmifilum lucidum]|uniref:AbrB/MazE/SpoVT family DNA-binding domain-containing protein n=1 Tax=Infirmifilum lucidum TaxID=2776706 RepID=A0A7L9FJZ4_9CREN|nr:AbrB/MazE/SpoVT family DNA-binding domain-containing protein [Infirmifilum lucidum]QOJ79254.1 AbrB/MazE/SpoVT family DNA-binding domain-containing protein [Infirmifilum lucidum]